MYIIMNKRDMLEHFAVKLCTPDIYYCLVDDIQIASEGELIMLIEDSFCLN